MYKISIVTVCYNAAPTIADTLMSINAQDYDNYEVIIVDGQSSDKTIELVNSLKTDKYLVLSEHDQGLYDAMNKGISLATGDVIHFLNADDRYANDTVLTRVVHELCVSKCSILFSDIAFINDKKETLSVWSSVGYSQGKISEGFHVPHPGFFAKKEIFDKLGGFDTSLSIAADFDLMSRFLSATSYRSIYLPIVTVEMSVNGVSSKVKNILKGFWEIRYSLKKLGIRSNIVMYILRRYVPKVGRKLKVMWFKQW